MQREIKFRAWDGTKMLDNPRFEFFNHGRNGSSVMMADENDNVQIMQFTGLKDKNGKECYESDLIEFEEPVFESDMLVCPVVFHEGVYCAEWEKSDGSTVVWFPLGDLEEFEIIGNRYQNPDLLK